MGSPRAYDIKWLLLAYRIPREPTRLRATVWRRIKALGAVYLQNSVAALPDSAAAERAMRSLRREILELGGTAQVMRADALVGASDLVDMYNGARDEEYTEIIDKCHDFLKEIENETAARHFTYAELEENDEDLSKLKGWFDKVTARDTLGASQRGDAAAALDECHGALDTFANHVYLAEDRP
ncbi:ChrB domain-containing protein [Mycobacterium malmoense]|uniref:ChrB domain-containing protein n=1 Tax=Mycobacterium malmoense TaxID=1780 RepID=A0ABX3SML3_MYCMA|nr:Chromate resistance protein ChrB [Mycobacterium malmoense]ORA78371.1 ChrB domain-containing protein [Mycobacterium malmoense]QZA16294.1 ChrB domain-containing protein [Mycobacterium malmoense]